ncbi:Jag family protein [Haliovirga abyssi]|uniref:R3H domain-containing protein n=1 Tax=Haliovirga abyssi TaxID=2996794 RepID=A0AAU9DY98_9FUSO|nr:R3H domain-containing nucleic acid-binding protein [Haliovirga abyssi]BDU51496.1 hypothetical protein HLVA_20650 [Haliovirga abyssi]
MEIFEKIKANSKEEAIKIFKEEKKDSDIVKIEELEAPKSFLGLFPKKGEFKIFYKVLKNEIEAKTKKLLELMGLDLEVKTERVDARKYNIFLSGKDNGIIIGKKGKTLNSFEKLLNNLFFGNRIYVDVEEFKKKREETLITLSHKLAKKVIATQKAVKLNPMPPLERKIIHKIANEYEELETHSEGRDPKRYVIIKLKKTDD